MTAKYNQESKEWSLTLTNAEMATLSDCALWAKVDGDDEYAKQKQTKIQRIYNFIMACLTNREGL